MPEDNKKLQFGRFSSKPKLLIYICSGLLVLLIIIIYLFWYSSQDHSIYSKLSTENYSGPNFLNVSFKYPSVMKYNGAVAKKLDKSNTPVVYSYNIDSTQAAFIALTYLPVVKGLNLDSAHLLAQIKNKTGDYITLLNNASLNRYSQLYGSCQSYITNSLGQTGLVCTTSTGGFTTSRVVGVTSQNQYIFILVMPNSVWTQHQKIWQQVEKSFTY